MTRPVPRPILLCILPLLAAGLGAAQDQDKEGSKDHPLISRYPGSVITMYTRKDYDEFTLPLGKSDGEKFDKSQRLEGKVTHVVYQCPEGRSTLEVFRNYQSALARAGFQTLFTCARDECMTVDGMMNLYDGYSDPWDRDQEMRYTSAKLTRPEGEVYVSLNAWGPGTAQPQVSLYVVEMKPMEAGMVSVNAATLERDITRTGHAAVYGIYFDTGKWEVKPQSDPTLREVAKLLEQDPSLTLYVVGHTDNVGTFASNMDLSNRRAAAVVEALTTKYRVPVGQLHGEGVGPLSPVAPNLTEEGRAKNRRVELVKQ